MGRRRKRGKTETPELKTSRIPGLHTPTNSTRECTSGICSANRPSRRWEIRDRKSTRLNSSHRTISYAVFCLKKKKKYKRQSRYTNKNILSTESSRGSRQR